jgi:hypothetical protein
MLEIVSVDASRPKQAACYSNDGIAILPSDASRSTSAVCGFGDCWNGSSTSIEWIGSFVPAIRADQVQERG